MGTFARLTSTAPWLNALALAAVATLGVSCGSEPEELDDPQLPEVATNPDGISYPTDHLGGAERSAKRPGDRIPNFTFRGYRDGDRAKGLTTVSLADYFDPDQKRNKVLYIQYAATWCAVCSGELEASITITEKAKERGIVLLEVVVSGATAGKGPSLDEFDGWIDRHGTNFTTAFDVRAKRTSRVGVNGRNMPHDMLIDTRTMEILDSSVGAPSDVGHYALEALDFVEKNPPSTWP